MGKVNFLNKTFREIAVAQEQNTFIIALRIVHNSKSLSPSGDS